MSNLHQKKKMAMLYPCLKMFGHYEADNEDQIMQAWLKCCLNLFFTQPHQVWVLSPQYYQVQPTGSSPLLMKFYTLQRYSESVLCDVNAYFGTGRMCRIWLLEWLDVTCQLLVGQLMNKPVIVKHEQGSWCYHHLIAQPDWTLISFPVHWVSVQSHSSPAITSILRESFFFLLHFSIS